MDDVDALWQASFTGPMATAHWITEMARPRSDVASEAVRYGFGF